jgi:Family of unknown function (DUF5681)
MPSDKRVIEYQRDPDAAPDHTGAKQVSTRFKPGVSGNPAGRPRGSRAKLGQDFLDSLYQAFQVHGETAIEAVAKKEPSVFLKIIKDLLPREILLNAFSLSASMDIASVEDAKMFLHAYRLCRDKPLEHVEEGTMVTQTWRADD